MIDTYLPKMKDISLGELPPDMFKAVLQRNILYEFTDFLQPAREERWILSGAFHFKDVLVNLARVLLDDQWYMMASDPGDGKLPSLVFQKDEITLLACGARAGKVNGVHYVLTGPTRDLLRHVLKRWEGRINDLIRQ